MSEEIRLHEGELNIMELLWSNKVLAAKDIAKIIKEYIGWEKNTTYTVINRLIDKGAIKREEPGFSAAPQFPSVPYSRLKPRLCWIRYTMVL